MSFYECYCDECKSEADEIIEEARDKLVDLITDRESHMYSCFMTKPELHRVKEEAQAVIDKRNAESREKAIKELDGEE